MKRIDAGKAGEDAALSYLEARGYELLERNYRADRCEIDLIMLDGGTTVFVEVKARSGMLYGAGREAVTKAKRANICRAALIYAAQKGIIESPMRFDVVEVKLPGLTVEHIINAFPYEG